MTDTPKFDIFDPNLLPERPVSMGEMMSAFDADRDALRNAWKKNKLPPPAEENWFRGENIWYVAQLRDWFRVRAENASKRDRRNLKTAVE